jgi:fructokinase
MQTPIVIYGEALMDCIARPDGSFMPHAGGSPYNVARAIALQGGAVTFANPLSTDEMGQQLKHQLTQDGVKLGMSANNLPTSLAMVSFVDGQPSYQFYRDGVSDRAFTTEQALTFLDSFPSAGILHTGSLALVPPEVDKTLAMVKAAKARGWTISCDINLRPRLARDMDQYRTAILECMALADWLKASDEDLITLLGSAAGQLSDLIPAHIVFGNAAAIGQAIHHLGCQRIAVTYGEQGALLRVGSDAQQAAAPTVKVIDTVGCGDTFWGSCILAWARGELSVDATLNRALKAAAINATRAGCHPPSAKELRV